MQHQVEQLGWPTQKALFLAMKPPNAPGVIDDARERLILANVPLANKVASTFRERFPTCKLDREDMAGECFLILVRCVDRYSLHQGARFSKYFWESAWYWLAGCRDVDRGGVICLKKTSYNDVRAYRRVERSLREAGRPSTQADVIRAMDLHPIRAEGLRAKMSLLQSRRAFPGSDGFLGNLPDREHSDEATRHREAAEKIRELVRCLDARDRQAVEMVYGLAGGPAMTRREAGVVMGVSHERIKQRLDRAVQKMARAAGRQRPRRPLVKLAS